jgi:iron(III) transport system permease protein
MELIADRPSAVLDPPERRAAPPRQRRVTLGVVVAVLVTAPLLALPTGFVRGGGLDTIARTLLPDALRTSLVLAAGVAVLTFVIGTALALVVSFYDFPGRRLFDWLLVLPMAMPAYVLVYVVLGQYGLATPLQSNLFGNGLELPGLRSTTGAILVLSAVLYPYVYLLARSAFLGQSRQTIEAARSLGRSYPAAIVSVAIPMARPALAAGVTITVMEALADFGTVDLLGVQALTSAIYRVWYGGFDQAAGLQLATVLVTMTITVLVIERVLRGRAHYQQALGRGDAIVPRPMRRSIRWVPTAMCTLLLLGVFVVPVIQLVAWASESIVDGTVAANLTDVIFTTVFVSVVAALLALLTGVIVAHGQRTNPTTTARATARLSTVGYGVPGTVVAVAVLTPLIWFDRRLVDVAADLLGRDIGLLFTGSMLGLLVAYLVRFHALSFLSLESTMSRIGGNLDDAARSLGADRARVLADVHLPLLRPGLATAALLVFVEVMKELPATALLRPLGADTLAITVWEATKDSRVDTAALPALLIVAVGIVPVLMLLRLRSTPDDDRLLPT